jgi:hypothetical protein
LKSCSRWIFIILHPLEILADEKKRKNNRSFLLSITSTPGIPGQLLVPHGHSQELLLGFYGREANGRYEIATKYEIK